LIQVQGDWVSQPETQALFRVLTDAGYRALFVGGCVRNALLGAAVNDIDLATDALPQRVMELTKAAGMKAVPTGVDHGTVTIVVNGHPLEVTTFRRDVETFGRHAVVAYTDKVEEDARRRDFTMNALYAEPDGSLVDPLAGLGDLRAARVRFIEDADARIQEDYLRILRFFRFHALYGDQTNGFDPDGLAACAAHSAGLETLSKERVGAELLKLLSAPNPAPSVAGMVSTGCLLRVLPGADATALPILVHLENSMAEAPDAIRRLAILGGEDVPDRLRLSKANARALERLRNSATGTASAAELAYRFGFQSGLDACLIRAALFEAPLPPDLTTQLDSGAGAKFPISARDLQTRFQGPALGTKLRELETAWIASGFTLSRADLLAKAT